MAIVFSRPRYEERRATRNIRDETLLSSVRNQVIARFFYFLFCFDLYFADFYYKFLFKNHCNCTSSDVR